MLNLLFRLREKKDRADAVVSKAFAGTLFDRADIVFFKDTLTNLFSPESISWYEQPNGDFTAVIVDRGVQGLVTYWESTRLVKLSIFGADCSLQTLDEILSAIKRALPEIQNSREVSGAGKIVRHI